MPTTRAITFHDYGDPDVLRLEEVERPEPGTGEVLVRVRATGVHPMDWKFRAGYLKERMPLQLPHVLGWEFAGTVEEVGADVDGLKPGDDVFGRGSATYSDYAVAPVKTIAKKPAGISFEEAATLGLSGVTAWQLVETAGLESGQRVLVHGGAGGVGALAVQLARHKGAHVIATTSTANLEHVRALGADEVVDYTAGPFEERVRNVDTVLDTVGGDTTARSFDVLKSGGLLISIAGMVDEEEAARRGLRTARTAQVEETAPILAELAELIASGAVQPQVAETYPLSQAADAHAASQTGHGRGRRVLTMTS